MKGIITTLLRKSLRYREMSYCSRVKPEIESLYFTDK